MPPLKRKAFAYITHWHPAEGHRLLVFSLFELFWARLPDGVPDLIADHGIMLPALIARLDLDT